MTHAPAQQSLEPNQLPSPLMVASAGLGNPWSYEGDPGVGLHLGKGGTAGGEYNTLNIGPLGPHLDCSPSPPRYWAV